MQGAATVPDADLTRQREVVGAFIAAARGGDLNALLEILDPNVVLRADRGAGASRVVRGSRAVAGQALHSSRSSGEELFIKEALVNGAAGVVVFAGGRPFSVMGFTVAGGKIVAIDILADPARLRQLDLAVFKTDQPI